MPLGREPGRAVVDPETLTRDGERDRGLRLLLLDDRSRGGTRHTPAQLVAGSRIPERFRAAHQLYLEIYAQRISDVYATTRHEHNSLEHLWLFLDERFPRDHGDGGGASRAAAGVHPSRAQARA